MAAALAVIAGLAVFLAVGQPASGQRTASAAVLGLAAAAAVGLIGLCTILAGRFLGSWRALLFGAGGGVAAGVTDALIKWVTVVAAGRLLALFADARLYLLIVVGPLTYTIQQNGYRAAALAAFLPAFAVIEPVSGSLLGLIIYHERLSACFSTSAGACETAGHEGDHGPVDGGLVVGGQVFVVADAAAVAGDPGPGSPNHPAAGQDPEGVQVI